MWAREAWKVVAGPLPSGGKDVRIEAKQLTEPGYAGTGDSDCGPLPVCSLFTELQKGTYARNLSTQART